ncbi:SspB family protein [Mangrovicoccus sp. HB161399]|uniref:SspB family protein n=1 Tax=Mangrovicoccus sp. HB161399 TaxID=2720392 RepID=UPI0015555E8B|nr:ClpXP protease specificity-enhancing factor SspB [Mangrovicoccus sp. HB161399]
MARTIDYGNMMHRAMRGLIRQVLGDVADHGLPGEHHFFITFDTKCEGVEVADWLLDLYPSEMTIVIQHWYDNLVVDEDGFRITLNFGDQPEELAIPYTAIRTFVDPSVEFGLRFETTEMDDEDEDDDEDAPMAEDVDPEPEEKPRGDAEVVSLDSFRK